MNLPISTLELALAILCAEFALVALIVPVVLLRRERRRAAGEAASAANAVDAAQEMMDDVEQAEPARREALATIFASTYNLEEGEVAERVDEFIAREQAFYQVMTSVYLERDSARLKEIPEELTKVISPWIRMTPSNMVDAAEVDALTESNSALGAELEETRRSMDELMAEYMKAFHKNAASRDGAAPLAAAAGAAQRSAADDDDVAILDGDDSDAMSVSAAAAELAAELATDTGAAAVVGDDAMTSADDAAEVTSVGAETVSGLEQAEDALADIAADIDALIDDADDADDADAPAREDAVDPDAIVDELLDAAPQGGVEAAAEGERAAAPAAMEDTVADGAAEDDLVDEVFIDVSADDDDAELEGTLSRSADTLSQEDADDLASLFDDELAALDAVDAERDEAAA